MDVSRLTQRPSIKFPCLVGGPCSPRLGAWGHCDLKVESESAGEVEGSAEWGRRGENDPGQGAAYSKVGDEKGWWPCVDSVEPHTAEVVPDVGQMGRGQLGHGVCLDVVLREMGSRGNPKGFKQENGRIGFAFFKVVG